jgi:calcineurin-like phosphoesterase family protein
MDATTMTIFITSDSHFSHANILSFTIDDKGTLLRPGFKDVTEMDETMVERWNAVVKPSDHVWHLGDVAMKRQALSIVKRLNGHKRLVFGNHDIYGYEEYAQAGFEKLAGMRVIDGIIMTHIPLHPDNLQRFKLNVHGHIHAYDVMNVGNWSTVPDSRYFNACVERHNYTPIPLEEIKRLAK